MVTEEKSWRNKRMCGERLIKHHIFSSMQNLGRNTHGMKAKGFRLVGRGLARMGGGSMGEGTGVMNISQVQYVTYV